MKFIGDDNRIIQFYSLFVILRKGGNMFSMQFPFILFLSVTKFFLCVNEVKLDVSLCQNRCFLTTSFFIQMLQSSDRSITVNSVSWYTRLEVFLEIQNYLRFFISYYVVFLPSFCSGNSLAAGVFPLQLLECPINASPFAYNKIPLTPLEVDKSTQKTQYCI